MYYKGLETYTQIQEKYLFQCCKICTTWELLNHNTQSFIVLEDEITFYPNTPNTLLSLLLDIIILIRAQIKKLCFTQGNSCIAHRFVKNLYNYIVKFE